MTRGRGLLLAAAFVLGSGCSSPAGQAPEAPAHPVRVPPALAGYSGQLVAVAERGRLATVRIRNQARVFKPGREILASYGETFVGVLNPLSPAWIQRVLLFPFSLLTAPFDLSTSRGSGFFLTNGYVVTNAHVVDNAAELTCSLTDGRTARATVAALDDARDLALLSLTGLEGAPPPGLPLRPTTVQPGEPIVALGHPSRETFAGWDELAAPPNPKATVGVVSAADVQLGNPNTTYIETDAALNPGSSGGPLLDLDGRVVGIATLIGAGKQSEGYAVPALQVWSAFRDRLRSSPHAGTDGPPVDGPE